MVCLIVAVVLIGICWFINDQMKSGDAHMREVREREQAARAREAHRRVWAPRIGIDSPPTFGSYERYMQSAWWGNIRQHTLEWLGGECEFCGRSAVQVHHVRYPKKFGTESVKSLYAVCKSCHEVLHGKPMPNHSSRCTFCGDRAKGPLIVERAHYQTHQSHTRSSTVVCWRCDLLARGFRRRVLEMTQEEYDDWVEKWRHALSVRPFDTSLGEVVEG